jgi:capsular exopolysaccharide synthesis family protein
MKTSEFPLEKNNGHRSDLSIRPNQRPALYAYVESPGETSAAPAYDSLREYWRVLVHHKKTLLISAAVGLLAAILVSIVQTPIYRVRTSLEIQDSTFLEMKNAESGESAGSYASPESYVETQVKLLQSESLLDLVIDKLKLHKERPKNLLRAFAARVLRVFDFSNTSNLPERDALIKQIQRNLTVRSSGNSRLLEVLYESPDPRLAADFANTLVSEFIEQTQEERWKSAQRTAEWLTNHLDKMKAQLEASEAQLQNYAVTSGLSVTSEKENPAEDRLKELQDELSKAQADRIAKQAKFDEAQNKPADSLPEISDDPTMREYRQKLTELQRQYVELSATLTPQHYKVQRVQAQIDDLKAEMQKERVTVRHRVGNEYAAAQLRERLLSEAHANQEKLVADQSSKAIHYDTLKRDVDSNRKLYETMLQRVKEASLVAAMRDSNVLVIDRARPPVLPYRPDVPVNAAIGLLSGVFLGFGFVLLRERIDHRISAPGDAQVYLDLPELGVIPLDESAVSAHGQITRRLHAQRPAPLPAPGSVSKLSQSDCPELATWKRKPSLLAECARTTLTSLLLPGQDGEAPRVVVLTSARPGDGKTTVACNLSIAMAEIGRKVLMLDCDLRRPRLHKVFGVANSWGLGNILCGDTLLENVPTSHLVRQTEVAGLSLIPGGICGVTPSNLFFSPRMGSLLKRLREEFDMVMIDAPPMIHLADARVLGRLADGVILVVRAGQTTTEGARFVSQRFAEDGTRVIGTVLNSWDPRSSERYGYGSYHDYKEYAAT